VKSNGTLVLAAPRDHTELNRFARATQNYKRIAEPDLATLEPHLAGRFSAALMFESEAHLATDHVLQFMLNAVKGAGVTVLFSTPWHEHDGKNSPADDVVIDCRGIVAKANLPNLRGVRGERVLIKTSEVHLNRPVRLLHPRHPLYVVPWGDGRFVLGATVIESEDAGGVSVRSALELLGAAYALHPAFSEAEIMDLGAGLRPAFADNIPRIVICNGGRHLIVNGSYRHGFLLAPILAEATADFLASGTPHDFIKQQETACPTGKL
jgi:glycine oxidase